MIHPPHPHMIYATANHHNVTANDICRYNVTANHINYYTLTATHI